MTVSRARHAVSVSVGCGERRARTSSQALYPVRPTRTRPRPGRPPSAAAAITVSSTPRSPAISSGWTSGRRTPLCPFTTACAAPELGVLPLSLTASSVSSCVSRCLSASVRYSDGGGGGSRASPAPFDGQSPPSTPQSTRLANVVCQSRCGSRHSRDWLSLQRTLARFGL